MLAIGIRTNMANIAATNFGRAMMLPVSRQTVTKAEVMTGNALVVATAEFYQVMRDLSTGIPRYVLALL